MTYALGAKSLANLARVHPDLLAVVKRAIATSAQDFGVTEPQVRTLEYQKQLVARGVSQTLKSNHLERVDYTGKTKTLYGHAVDLVPWDGAKFVWDWDRGYVVASAMAHAAHDFGFRICWGGCWSRWMDDYRGDAAAMKTASQSYVKSKGGKAFLDAPHFQLGKLG